MAKTKKKKSTKSKKIISLLGLAGMAPGLAYAWSGSTMTDKLNKLTLAYTGYDPAAGSFQLGNLTRGALPLVTALVAKKVLNKLGAGNLFRNVPVIGL